MTAPGGRYSLKESFEVVAIVFLALASSEGDEGGQNNNSSDSGTSSDASSEVAVS